MPPGIDSPGFFLYIKRNKTRGKRKKAIGNRQKMESAKNKFHRDSVFLLCNIKKSDCENEYLLRDSKEMLPENEKMHRCSKAMFLEGRSARLQ